MKHTLFLLCFCFTFILPVTQHADVQGEIVFVHPVKPRELWITKLKTGANPHKIYAHEEQPNYRIIDIVSQKDADLIAFLARSGDEAAGEYVYNIYIVDKTQKDEKATNITQDRFGVIPESSFDISKNGDIVFTSTETADITAGIYLIPHTEFQEAEPRAQLIVKNGTAPSWFPDGKRIALGIKNHIFIFTVGTGTIKQLNGWGFLPTISPDGRYLARAHSLWGTVFNIEIYSLTNNKIIANKKLTTSDIFMDFKWSPDVEQIVYTTLYSRRKHYAISFDENSLIQFGNPVEFLQKDIFGHHITTYDWTFSGVYPVEPKNRLTTLWGKIKQ